MHQLTISATYSFTRHQPLEQTILRNIVFLNSAPIIMCHNPKDSQHKFSSPQESLLNVLGVHFVLIINAVGLMHYEYPELVQVLLVFAAL